MQAYLPRISVIKRTFSGKSVDEAREAALAAVGPDRILRCDVTQYGFESIFLKGTEAKEALQNPSRFIPSVAFDIDTPKILQQEDTITAEVAGYSEKEAFRVWQESRPYNATLQSFVCIVKPSKGLLGWGRRKGSWRAQFSIPLKVQISFRVPAEVTVRYKPKLRD